MSNLTKATSEKNEHSNSFYHALKTKILEAEKKTINSIQNIQDTFLGKDAQLIAAKRAEIMSNLEEKYFEEAEIRRLLSRMSDEKTGLRLRKHSWKGAKGFTGAEAVDWLTNDIHSWSRHKASRFCQILMDQKAIVALKDSNPDNATNLELFQDKKTRGYTFTWFKTKKLKKKDNKKGDQPDMEEVPSGSKSQRDYPTQPTAESILRTRSESFDNGLKSSVTFPLGHVSHAKSVDKTGTPDRTDKVEHRRRSIDVDNNAKVPPVFVPSHHRSASIASTPHQNLKSPKHATILNTSAEDKTDSSNKRSNDREERQKKRASKSSKHVRVFKCFLDDDVRLLTVETKQLSVQYLIAQVTEEYNRERLVIKFMDEDGDLIRITKQQDLDYFLALYGHSKALKLFVFEDKGLVTSGTMYSPGLSQSSQHLNESKRSDDSGDSTDYELTDSVDILKPHSGNSVRLTNGSNGNTSSNSTNAYYVVETSKSLNNNLPTSGSAVIKQSNSVGPMTSPRDRLSNGSSSSYMWEIPKEQLSFGQVLGKGFFGEVRKGKWRGSDVAIKIIYRESFKEKNDEDLFIREVEILTKLRHPRVILFLGAVLSPECKAIVTEFMKGGSLYDLLHNPYQKQKHLPTNYQKLLTAIEIAQGMSYLHGIPILHRDLSCRNILMDEKYRAKVADFGLSKLKHDNKTISTTLGAVPWMSPEVIRGQVFTEKADVYSFGVVLWEMLTAKDPCPFDKTTLQLADMIAHHGYRPHVPEDCPIAWKKLMESCWSQEPEDRPDFNEILLSLEDMKRDPAFQRHRSVPNTPAAQMAKSDGDAIPVIHEGINSLNITSNASSTDKSPMSHSLQERIDYSSSSEGSDSDSDNPPQPKEKITSGYVD